MRPKQQQAARHDDLFRARLDQIINMKHELVALANKVDWGWIDDQLADHFSDQGRPAEPVRFMIGMLMLKHTYALSDEQLWERWVQDPYFQYFTGEEFFQHDLPHERSGLSHWRKRIGDKLEILLQESLRIAEAAGALSKRDLARVTVDTTVQPKNVAFPTDARLLESAIQQLGKLAKALPGNPYDGHTLKEVIEETETLTGREIERAYVDKGYVGHDAAKPNRVFKSGQKRGVHGQIKKELRRRSAIEAVIGHCKTDGHMARNFLKRHLGDQINVVMTAVGYNFRLILKWLKKLLGKIIAAI